MMRAMRRSEGRREGIATGEEKKQRSRMEEMKIEVHR
jgi:hypothetical protein